MFYVSAQEHLNIESTIAQLYYRVKLKEREKSLKAAKSTMNKQYSQSTTQISDKATTMLRNRNNMVSTFSIGPDASRAFTEFIHDGDFGDERVDNEQTVHWSAVQDHI